MSETLIIAIIIFIIASFLVQTELYRTHDFTNPFVIFVGFWGIIVLLAGMSLFGMEKVSFTTYVYVFIGLMFFAISWFLYESLPKVTIKQTKNWRFDTFKYPILWVILIVCFIFYLYYSWCTLERLLSGYSYVDIRNIHQGYVEELAFENKVLSLMGFVFCAPIVKSAFAIVAVNYFRRREGRDLLILSSVCILLEFFSTASRFSLIYVILIFFILLLKYRETLQKKTRKRIIYIVVILGIVVFVMVWLRSLGKSTSVFYNISETLYHYLASPIPLLNEKIKAFGSTNGHTYGKMFIYGFLDLFDSVLKYMKIASWDFLSNAKFFIMDNERFVRIYKNHNFNAFVSIFYYFYIDFGVPGIALGSAIWAFLLHYVYDKYKSSEDIGVIAIFCEFVFFIILSGIRWPFSTLNGVLLVLYTLWLTSGVQIKYRLRRN